MAAKESRGCYKVTAVVRSFRVLDAGCGRHRPYVDYGPEAHVVGLDISEEALSLNELVDEKIVGDVQTYPLPADAYDVIICWDVLEHLPEPRRALDNLAAALALGGELVIGVPNLISPKGLLTKFTPFSFHVWVYRHVYNMTVDPESTADGPYRTYLRWSIRPSALRRWATVHNLEVAEFTLYASDHFKPLWRRYRAIHALLQVLWFWGDPDLTECRLVLRKPVGVGRS